MASHKCVLAGILLLVELTGVPTTAGPDTDLGNVSRGTSRVPVECETPFDAISCGDDISLEQARESSRILSECTQEDRIANCKNTLTSATDFLICEEISAIGWRYVWAPVSRIRDGEEAFKLLLERARTGIPFTIKGHISDEKYASVITETTLTTDSERHLALCSVIVANGNAGPPLRCVTVAVISETEVLLRSLFWDEGSFPSCQVEVGLRSTGTIDFVYMIMTKLAAAEFGQAIVDVLTKHVGVATELIKDNPEVLYVKGVSFPSPRDSKVLPSGWREFLDVDIHIGRDRDGTLIFRGTLHAMVNRQARANVVEYAGPNDYQRSLYQRTLDDSIKQALKETCKLSYEEVDSRYIRCGDTLGLQKPEKKA